MDNDLDVAHDSGSRFVSSSSATPRFTIDEGFSEDSQNQIESSYAAFDATAAHFQQWIQAQKTEIRAEVAYEILRTLRTSEISAIVEKLTPLLHMDPIEKLPVEVTCMIFSYLDAKTLLTASLASRTWRERILDTRLWQELYRSEGWNVNAQEIKLFEKKHADLMRNELQKVRGQMRQSLGKGKPLSKRRATSDWLDSKQRRVSADVNTWREQHGVVEADTDYIDGGDEEMYDVSPNALDSPSRPNKRQSQDSGDEMDISQDSNISARGEPTTDPASIYANFLVSNGYGYVKMNWPHLYKQRHRLEENWLRGKYTNFQLPHPNHLYEAHTECVYTIQFSGKWLLSGSRDKTLRIWDLETRRLKGKPLTGHSQSVLCLQFDPSDEEDVIISGSSDSSVIVWKFSTGQKLHIIPSAHEESVLNLKFDKRFLVTCSKDKKIKIWNRHALAPTDPDYPKVSPNGHAKYPSYIIDTSELDLPRIEARLANGQYKALQPYMHLLTLEGHGAAVNAIQISGDLVVSASGDRLIRIWSIKNGVCIRVLPGHQKGIACVQFDNKRVVSGSSDNTVRVYDLLTGVEVACLYGHQNLVRTVQAGFGDAPGSDEEDALAARAAERACLEDITAGRVIEDRQLLRRVRNGEASSSKTGVGSRLPPGGGGSKWGRIVSGSYDESIIIWKRDSEGNWVPGQTLKQDAIVRTNIENDRGDYLTGNNTQIRRRNRPQNNASVGTAVNSATISASQIVQQAVNVSMAGLQNGSQNVMRIPQILNGSWQPNSGHGNTSQAPNPSISATPAAIQTAVAQIANHAQIAASNAIQQLSTSRANIPAQSNSTSSQSHAMSSTGASNQAQASSSTAVASTTLRQTASLTQTNNPSASAQIAPAPTPTPTPTPTTAPAPTPTPTPAPTPTPTPAPAPTTQPAPQNPQTTIPSTTVNESSGQTATQANNPGNPAQNAAPVSRVFKLQFDARRIICCSQDFRIVGWDFANGDPDIEAASKFFIAP